MSQKGLVPPKEKLNLFSNSPRSELFDRLIRDFASEFFHDWELNASTRDLFKELLFAIYEKISEGHHRFFVISDNPVFVWLCMAELREFTLSFDRFLHDVFPEDCGKPLLKEVPEWIASYMAESALGIHALVTKISPAESGRSKTRASEVTPGQHTRGGSSVKSALKRLFEEDFHPTTEAVREEIGDQTLRNMSWAEIEPFLSAAAADIRIMEINGTARDVLEYTTHRDTGLNVIAIGGDKLARGLTLEGLSVSYFLRASRMYDTLMQMGRWFGYQKQTAKDQG